MSPLTNWAGNVTYAARRVLRPTSVDELRGLVAASDSVRAVGSGHSFNRIADTTGDLVSVADLPEVCEVDAAAGSVRVSAGLRYGEVAPRLEGAGLALPNMGSLPHISVAGACATGTHGAGATNRCLAAGVRAVEIVTADGEVVSYERGDPDFGGAVLALGTLGVMTALTLDAVPTYQIRQYVFDDLEFAALDEDLLGVLGSAYSVSVFTTWRSDRMDTVWLKQRVEDAPFGQVFRGARAADGPRHPVPGVAGEHCTEQGGVPGPWYARLPHFRLEFTPSSGAELQSEWFVPREHGPAALRAVREVREVVAPVLQIAEVRAVAGDDLWFSPASGRDSVGLHFTWVPDADAVRPVVQLLEEQLAPYAARPHWAKVFTAEPADVASTYPRLADAVALGERLDPAGVFRNAFVDRYLPRAG